MFIISSYFSNLICLLGINHLSVFDNSRSLICTYFSLKIVLCRYKVLITAYCKSSWNPRLVTFCSHLSFVRGFCHVNWMCAFMLFSRCTCYMIFIILCLTHHALPTSSVTHDLVGEDPPKCVLILKYVPRMVMIPGFQSVLISQDLAI